MANQIENWSKDGFPMVRIRAGGGKQLRLTIATRDAAVAEARIARLEQMSHSLIAKGLMKSAAFLLKKAAAQASDEAFDLCLQTAAALAPRTESKSSKPRTFQDLGELWTSGELHRLYPDNVKLKASSDDDERLLGWHYKTIGGVLLTEFATEHYWMAMRSLPPTAVRPMTRLHYAQVIAKVLRLAVFPVEAIPLYPLPVKNLMPVVVKGEIAFPYLFPDEDLALMSRVPATFPKLQARVDADWYLVARAFFGVLNREGMRIDECLGMTWRLQDFRHGIINIGPRKNGLTGSWPAAEGTLEALEVLRERFGGEGPFDRLPKDEKWAWRLRQMLLAAGQDRHALHHGGEGRRRLRGHDTRSTFVTLRLAQGWSEGKVSLRTGHMSSEMINTYRRQMESVRELGYVNFLTPLDVALGLRVLADGPTEAVVRERQLDEAPPSTTHQVPSSVGENAAWGETTGETEIAAPGGEPGGVASETLSVIPGVAKTGLEPVRPCGRRILKPPQTPGKPSFPVVPMDGTTPKAPDVSASEAPSRQPEADPKRAYLEQLHAAVQGAIADGRWEDVAALGKLIDSAQGKAAAGTTRAPAEAAPAPRNAGTSALAETVAEPAKVVALSSRLRRGGT